ncbi:MAG: hypoxanthine phosphoribosyltransferase [Bacillota bacterium]
MRRDRDDLEKVIKTKEEIQKRVEELGLQLANEYEGCNPVVLGILKGANVFMADLVRAMDIELQMDFMVLGSYGLADKPGEVEIKKDCETDLAGRHVLVVDDIADTGQTLKTLAAMLKKRGAASVKSCVLLDKPARRTVDFVPDYIGFEIEDAFVVGYGLDYAERFRNLPEVCAVKKHVYGAE